MDARLCIIMDGIVARLVRYLVLPSPQNRML